MIKRVMATTPIAIRHCIMMVACALAVVTYSTAVFPADAQRGKQFASRICAFCHAVFEGHSRDPDAPPFRSIATSREFHEKGAALLSEPHPKMPNLGLTQEQIDDVAAYIRSLAK